MVAFEAQLTLITTILDPHKSHCLKSYFLAWNRFLICQQFDDQIEQFSDRLQNAHPISKALFKNLVDWEEGMCVHDFMYTPWQVLCVSPSCPYCSPTKTRPPGSMTLSRLSSIPSCLQNNIIAVRKLAWKANSSSPSPPPLQPTLLLTRSPSREELLLVHLWGDVRRGGLVSSGASRPPDTAFLLSRALFSSRQGQLVPSALIGSGAVASLFTSSGCWSTHCVCKRPQWTN